MYMLNFLDVGMATGWKQPFLMKQADHHAGSTCYWVFDSCWYVCGMRACMSRRLRECAKQLSE